MGKKLVDESQT